MKANNNLFILDMIKNSGAGVGAVSGNEVKVAKLVGFDSSKIIYNGNRKTVEEIKIGLEEGVMFSVDSEFDTQKGL